MNKEELQKNIALYYSKLPPTAQKVFSEMKWLESVKEICSNLVLTQEETESIATETTLVLLAVISIAEYKESIKNITGINSSIAEKIYEQVDEMILRGIRGDIVKAFEENSKPEVTENDLVESTLDERFANLPANIKKAIEESEYDKKLYAISQEQNLTIEQIGKLEKIVVDTILGKTSGTQIESVIKMSLQIEDEKALQIVAQVNEKILKPIRIKMMGNYGTLNHEELELPAGNPENKTSEVVESREELLKQLEIPATTTANPLLNQKLAGSFQMESTKTEHTLENISKEAPKPKAPMSYPPKADPYRLSPDE